MPNKTVCINECSESNNAVALIYAKEIDRNVSHLLIDHTPLENLKIVFIRFIYLV